MATKKTVNQRFLFEIDTENLSKFVGLLKDRNFEYKIFACLDDMFRGYFIFRGRYPSKFITGIDIKIIAFSNVNKFMKCLGITEIKEKPEVLYTRLYEDIIGKADMVIYCQRDNSVHVNGELCLRAIIGTNIYDLPLK